MIERSCDLEEVPCPGCDSNRRTPCREGRDPALEPGIRFRIVRCDDCGLHYTSPRPISSAISRYYPAEYHCHQLEEGLAAGPEGSLQNLLLRSAFGAPSVRPSGLGRAVARVINAVRPPQRFGYGITYRGRGRLLDFGCGSGKFLRRMQALGWDVTGMDFSDAAVRAVRTSGVPALAGSLPHPDLPPRSFDVITMRHALEHVPDPRSVLRGAWDLLDSGGLLLVQVPNFAGWEIRHFGDASLGVDLPRHLTHFTRATLSAIFERAGLRRPRVRLATHANWFRKAARRNGGHRRLDQLLRQSPPWCRVAAALCQMARCGNEIVATAVKPEPLGNA